ncbi:unnamed protein product [Malus baccata var. baccata]
MATLAFAGLTSPPFSTSRRSPSLLLPITCSSTEPNQNADDSEPKTPSLAPSSSSDLTYKLYAGLGGVGFLETTYLTYLKLTNSTAFCPTGGGGGGGGSCGDILSSDYAVVFGVPLPLFGMVAYGLVATLGVQLLTAKKLPFGISESNARLVLLGTTTSMAAASACFLYILSTKFSGASCSYCLLSALLSFTLFFTALKDFGLEKLQKEVGLLFCIASLVVVTLNRSYSALPPVPSSPSEIDLPYFSTEITTPSSPFAIALAKHLSAIGAKMYGAFWCSHCVEQKQMFGSEAAKLLNYVECFPGGFRKGTIMQKECFDVGIEGFPTWVINGQKIIEKERRRKMHTQISDSEQQELIEKLDIFKIKGRDKRGRTVLRIMGKFFPARIVSVDALRKYLEERIFPEIEKKPFAVLYVHTGAQRCENFPGISAVRSIYDAVPISVRQNLEAVYILHPGLQARLFLATFGRFFFTGGVYGKLRYVSRLDYLWEHVRRNEIEVPDFVYDHDEDLEHRPMMDYGLESDHPRVYDAPAVDSPVSTYSMRCIS